MTTAADEPKAAEKAGERIARTGVDFDTAYQRLTAGRPYDKEKTGGFSMRFQGGRAPSLARRRQENRIPGENQTYVLPGGFAGAAW